MEDSLLDRFPTEVLQQIFRALLVSRCWFFIWTERRKLSLVCRHFRDSAYSDPQLWARLTIHPFTRPDYIAFCLLRSGEAQLNVTVDARGGSEMWVGGKVLSVISKTGSHFHDILHYVLSPIFPRIRALSVTCYESRDWTRLSAAMSTYSGGNMTTLILETTEIEGAQERRPLLLNDAVALKTVIFVGVTPCLARGAYTSVTKLVLRAICSWAEVKWQDVHRALSDATCLEELHLDDIECDEIDYRLVAVLHRVERFKLSIYSTESLDVVNQIVMPALLSCRLDIQGAGSISGTASMQRAPLAHARAIDFCIGETTPEQMAKLLGTFPSAEELDFRRSTPSTAEVLIETAHGRWTTKAHKIMLTAIATKGMADLILRAINDESGRDDATVQAVISPSACGVEMEVSLVSRKGGILSVAKVQPEQSYDWGVSSGI
ncbi:hypothetical protein DFH09DRAFT_1444164, partial [Mycena vulgaris]